MYVSKFKGESLLTFRGIIKAPKGDLMLCFNERFNFFLIPYHCKKNYTNVELIHTPLISHFKLFCEAISYSRT